jgi:hypothetical protein
VPSYRLDYALAPEQGGKCLFTGKMTQSGVPGFLMGVPIYLDFDGKVVRAGAVAMTGNQTANEFKISLPKRPKRVLLNANEDVLAVEAVAKGM